MVVRPRLRSGDISGEHEGCQNLSEGSLGAQEAVPLHPCHDGLWQSWILQQQSSSFHTHMLHTQPFSLHKHTHSSLLHTQSPPFPQSPSPSIHSCIHTHTHYKNYFIVFTLFDLHNSLLFWCIWARIMLFLGLSWGLNELIYGKCLDPCLENGEPSNIRVLLFWRHWEVKWLIQGHIAERCGNGRGSYQVSWLFNQCPFYFTLLLFPQSSHPSPPPTLASGCG